MRPVTINGGFVMRAWYDIRGFGPDAQDDVRGLSDSVASVADLIERELARGIAGERIVLAGFSQGGAVVQHAGLGAAMQLGGVLGLSTYLPAAATLAAQPLRTDVPVWLAHGTHDAVIPLALAERSVSWLQMRGVDVEWSTWPMAHEVCFEEIRRLSQWLQRFAPA